MEELDFSRFLLISLERYLNNPNASFVLKEDDEYAYFTKCIESIRGLDKNATFYVTTYAEVNEKIYADNLLIRTTLSKDEICKVFFDTGDFDPYYIEKMDEEERDQVEWIDLDKKDFDDDKLNIFSLYWD